MDHGNIFNVDGPGLEELLAYMNQQNAEEQQPMPSAYPTLFGAQYDITALGLQLQPHLPESSPSATSSEDNPSLFNSMGSTPLTTEITANGVKADANGILYNNTATSQLQQQPTVKAEDAAFAVFSPGSLPLSAVDMQAHQQQPPQLKQMQQPPPLHLGASGLLHSVAPLASSTSNLLTLEGGQHPQPALLMYSTPHSQPFTSSTGLLMVGSNPMTSSAPSLPPPHHVVMHPPSMMSQQGASLSRPGSTPLPLPLPPLSSQKMHISHSSVEKQRRDRINSLLEELGDLIEPSDAKYSGEGGAARRPKHVLLADAIKVVHAVIAGLSDVRSAVKSPLSENGNGAVDGSAAPGPLSMNGMGTMAGAPRPIGYDEVVRTLNMLKLKAGLGETNSGEGRSEDEGMSGRALSGSGEVNLPQAPEDAPRFHGVMVEQKANNTFEVKVNCRDRRGLMLDIIAAMQNMQLVVTNATVTTRDNMVADIFEVVPGDDRAISSEDIQCSVWRALYPPNKARSSKRRLLVEA